MKKSIDLSKIYEGGHPEGKLNDDIAGIMAGLDKAGRLAATGKTTRSVERAKNQSGEIIKMVRADSTAQMDSAIKLQKARAARRAQKLRLERLAKQKEMSLRDKIKQGAYDQSAYEEITINEPIKEPEKKSKAYVGKTNVNVVDRAHHKKEADIKSAVSQIDSSLDSFLDRNKEDNVIHLDREDMFDIQPLNKPKGKTRKAKVDAPKNHYAKNLSKDLARAASGKTESKAVSQTSRSNEAKITIDEGYAEDIKKDEEEKQLMAKTKQIVDRQLSEERAKKQARDEQDDALADDFFSRPISDEAAIKDKIATNLDRDITDRRVASNEIKADRGSAEKVEQRNYRTNG